MAKFCGYCGSSLDEKTGLCPNCDKEKLKAVEIIPLKKTNSQPMPKKKNRDFRKINAIVLTCVAVIFVGAGGVLFGLSQGKKQAERIVVEETTPAKVETIPTVAQTQPEAPKKQTEPPAKKKVEEKTTLLSDALFDCSLWDDPELSYSKNSRMYCYHIPKINLPGQNYEKINQDIYKNLFNDVLVKEVYDGQYAPLMDEMCYSWAESKGIISILVCTNKIHDQTYYVYNIDKKTGTYLTDDQLIESFGFNRQSFEERIKEEMVEETKKYGYEDVHGTGSYQEEMYDDGVKQSLAAENIRNVMPFVDAKTGDLCAIGTIYTISGSGKVAERLNITGNEVPLDPQTYRDTTVRWGAETTANAPLTALQFRKIREKLEVPYYNKIQALGPVFTYQNLSFNEYAPESKKGWSQPGRLIEIGIDGKLVASAIVGTDPVKLLDEIMMYSTGNQGRFLKK